MKFLQKIFILILLWLIPTFSQELKDNFGLGLSFGTTLAHTDIRGYIINPISRILTRYYPNSNFGFEAGIGFGMLEGKKFGFFMSKIIPLDFRLLISPMSVTNFNPYAFAGISIMNFNPTDEHERPLPRNAKGEYSHWMATLPFGLGLQYFITRNSIVELISTYNLGTRDYLDDWKYNDNNDGYFYFGINVVAIFESGDSDPDRDGLKNRDEKQFTTDPYNPDTDADKLKDGEEVFLYKTNPLNPDSDNDKLTDFDEVFLHKTDPNIANTDGDGLNDGDEVLSYKTNPLKPDTDGDGLNDGNEVLQYKTNPLSIDTDGDRLYDGEEVLKYKTDPLSPDTDNDDLTDYQEVVEFVTNPLVIDTDNGGIPDGVEIKQGKDPNNPRDDISYIPDIGQRIILKGVNFEFNKSRLLPESMDTLNLVAASLMANPEVFIEISGHTDNIGSANANKILSFNRANAVKEYLVSKGVSPERIRVIGYGFERPIDDNKTPEGRARNRRVEILRTK